MRAWAVLLGLGMAFVGRGAWAQQPEVEERRELDPERLAPFGLMLDAGIPEGAAGLAVAWRASRRVRVELGGTYNGIRVGGRAGLTLLPMVGRATPTLSFEVGHARAGDADAVARRLADRTQPPSPGLDRVGYTYGSLHLGFEARLSRDCVFYLRGGANLMELHVPNLESLPEPFRESLGHAEVRGAHYRELLPSAKLGLVLSFG